MLKKLFIFPVLTFVSLISGNLMATTEFDFQDIGTLQTRSSCPIALNNRSEILGWYDIDGSSQGRHFFLKNQEGSYIEIPSRIEPFKTNWKFLTNTGTVFGIHTSDHSPLLYCWSQERGVEVLGYLPEGEVVSINDAGQVLIKNVTENINSRTYRYPVIWENGTITKLYGLSGDEGIPSDEAYGLDLNNQGEVVGYSVIHKIYKNHLYKQTHATKWINGHPIDLHYNVPKTDKTEASLINDLGEVVVGQYLLDKNGKAELIENSRAANGSDRKFNGEYFFTKSRIIDRNYRNIFSTGIINQQMTQDRDSIWLQMFDIIDVNEKGEIIAQGRTVYGEPHALFIYPVNKDH